MPRTALVVGASVAGVRTAQELRAQGWDGPVVVVGAEPELPYDKPPLSKQVLVGSWQPEQARLLDAEGALDAGIELRLGVAATALDPGAHRLGLADGSTLDYDVAVVATGAAARPSPWPLASGVHVLRTMTDALRLRDALARPGRVVVVGAGLIGGEVASAAVTLGHDVTLVDPLPAPAARLVGARTGALFTRLHRRHGVRTRLGVGVAQVSSRRGHLRLELTDGAVLFADTVVVGIGSVPVDGRLAGSGVRLDDGVVCDAGGAVVGAGDVYAVGDVARWHDPRLGRPTRAEHWTSAGEQAAHVARGLTGVSAPYTSVPYVWTDQHDWRAQVLGEPARGPATTVLGDPDAVPGRFCVVHADAYSLAGALVVNWPKGAGLVRRAIAAGDDLTGVLDRLRAALPEQRPGVAAEG